MGVQIGSQCVDSIDAAKDIYYSAIPPFEYLANTSNMALNQFTKVGSSWKLQRYSISTSSGMQTLNYSVDPPAIVFGSCNPSDNFFDGMTLGWGVASAMVAAWGIAFLAKRFR